MQIAGLPITPVTKLNQFRMPCSMNMYRVSEFSPRSLFQVCVIQRRVKQKQHMQSGKNLYLVLFNRKNYCRMKHLPNFYIFFSFDKSFYHDACHF